MAPRHLSRHTPPALRDSAVRLGRHSRGSAADADDMNGRLWSGEDQTNSDPDGNAGTVVAGERVCSCILLKRPTLSCLEGGYQVSYQPYMTC